MRRPNLTTAELQSPSRPHKAYPSTRSMDHIRLDWSSVTTGIGTPSISGMVVARAAGVRVITLGPVHTN